MENGGLVNRRLFSTSLEKELYKKLDDLSKETRIPKTRLLDEAIEDLLKKHGK
jgi:predicted DNA-binding protein